MVPNLLTSILAAATVLVLIIRQWNEAGNPYYSDSGRATYVHFLLHEARDTLVHEVTSMKHETFNSLISEFRENDLLKDGHSVSVEEQLLIFLNVVQYNNSMRETAHKFRRGLFTVHR